MIWTLIGILSNPINKEVACLNVMTPTLFKTKTEAKQAERKRKEELKNTKPVSETPTDMGFLELVNLRLDHVKAYNSELHYEEHVYKARKWIKNWGDLNCSEVTQNRVERFILERNMISAQTANKEIRLLRALFNFGKKKIFGPYKDRKKIMRTL